MENKILVPISPAELMDKISILELKEKKIDNIESKKNINHELALLRAVMTENVTFSDELESLFNELRQINANGWDIEDGKRECEGRKDFGENFVELARSAFKNNDMRSSIWRKINILLKSDIFQEKSYKKY